MGFEGSVFRAAICAAPSRMARRRGVAPLSPQRYGADSGIDQRHLLSTVVMQMVFMAHSGIRYLVLLAGIVSLLYFITAVATKKGNPRVSRILGSVFAGVLDLQIVLGLILVALGLYYPAILGHLFMMLFAAVCAHVAMAMAKSSADQGKADRLRLIGVLVAIVLIIAGIMAIGRPIMGSGTPTLG